MYKKITYFAFLLSLLSLFNGSTLMNAQGSIIRIKSGAELNNYIGKGNFVVVYFSSLTCGPCKAFHPVFESLAQQFSDVVFIEVTYGVVPDAANLINKYVVRSFPTFIFFDKAGNKTNSFSGGSDQTKSKIEAEIAKLKTGISKPSMVVSEVVQQNGQSVKQPQASAPMQKQAAAPTVRQPMQASCPAQGALIQQQPAAQPAQPQKPQPKKTRASRRTRRSRQRN